MNIKMLAVAGLAAAAVSTVVAAKESPAMQPADVILPEDMAWEKFAGAGDISKFYPVVAREAEVSGTAVVRCRVADDRRMQDCTVIDESPAGYGFGPATVRIAKKFRAGPATKSGQPTVGRLALIKMKWTVG